ncbi:peptide deformylase [Streptomyces sp. 4N509B]|uniref:peptide deformylase n=1 Tax=Streptomyces sp. 4N509B TaxID=3457413 RepID=UPI003FD4315A
MSAAESGSYAAELKRWRTVRGLTRAALAKLLNVSPSYVSHLEAGREHGSAALARRADARLNAAGALWTAWQNHDPADAPEPASPEPVTSTGLLVLADDAALSFDGGVYHLRMRRRLRNTGTEPVTRYLVRIAVDRYPADPARSNALYRANPLTWEELGLSASCGDEPMTWSVKHDRDAFKEVWLEFANDQARFPLYPGQETEIAYAYTVSSAKWGPWFQRAVRLPTRQLSVTLAFPTAAQPAVWGTENSLSAESAPLRTAPARTERGHQTVFSWSVIDPPLHARYRLEWRLKADEAAVVHDNEPVTSSTASAAMSAAGIVQDSDPALCQPARPFDLPAEADEARRVVRELLDAVERVRALHTFGKGMGIAAPQIGIPRSAAVVLPPQAGAEPLVLLNASVAESAAEEDEQYEGCLSFFDVRGLVPRPLRIVVAHTELDGGTRLTGFEYGLARLVAHEVDHLHGVLYRSRMRPGVEPIPVEEYRGTGQNWRYG